MIDPLTATQDDVVDARTIGILFYELLTGFRPGQATEDGYLFPKTISLSQEGMSFLANLLKQNEVDVVEQIIHGDYITQPAMPNFNPIAETNVQDHAEILELDDPYKWLMENESEAEMLN